MNEKRIRAGFYRFLNKISERKGRVPGGNAAPWRKLLRQRSRAATSPIEERPWHSVKLFLFARGADCQSSATPVKKISAGVFQSRHFLGRLFNKAITLSNNAKITALWKEETKQTICIFVCASLPRCMRFGEINGSFEVFFHLAERRKLGTIVERNALYRKAIQRFINSVGCIIRTACKYPRCC